MPQNLKKDEAKRLLGLLLRYYAGDAAAGKAGFEVDFEGGPAHHDEGRAAIPHRRLLPI